MARQGMFERSNAGLSITKWGLIIFNVAFWSIGVVSLAIGLWLYIANNEYATFSAGAHLYGSVFLIGVGFGITIVGFLGIVAAIWESVIISTAFAMLVIAASCLFLSSGIWSLVRRANVVEDARADLREKAMMYESNRAYAAVWDSLHVRFNCCGVVNFTEWQREFLRPPPRLPTSCCSNVSQENCQSYLVQRSIPGCLNSLVEYERRQYDIMAPIGLSFGIFQIFGMLLCLLFCITVMKTKQSYTPR